MSGEEAMQRTRTTTGLLLSFMSMSLAVTKISWPSVGAVLRRVIPPLSELGHKGSMGRIGVIGGSVDYCGAPYYSAVSALKFGADLSWVFCSQSSAIPIKAYSPELMVTPFYDENAFGSNLTSTEQEQQNANAVSKVVSTFPRLHVLVIGPGLGRNPRAMTIVSSIMREATKKALPMVIDGDGLFLLSKSLSLVEGNTRCILTPNAREFELLSDAATALCSARLAALSSASMGEDASCSGSSSNTCAGTAAGAGVERSGVFGTDSALAESAKDSIAHYQAVLTGLRGEESNSITMGENINAEAGEERKTAVLTGRARALSAALQGVTVLLKGASDIVASSGASVRTASTLADTDAREEVVYVVQAKGSPRRCGGLGDILSGTTAAALHWALERKNQLESLTGATRSDTVHAHDVNSTSTAASETAAETAATASTESQDRNACVQACALACMVSKRASELAFAAHGRSMTAPDVVEHIGAAFQEFYPEG